LLLEHDKRRKSRIDRCTTCHSLLRAATIIACNTSGNAKPVLNPSEPARDQTARTTAPKPDRIEKAASVHVSRPTDLGPPSAPPLLHATNRSHAPEKCGHERRGHVDVVEAGCPGALLGWSLSGNSLVELDDPLIVRHGLLSRLTMTALAPRSCACATARSPVAYPNGSFRQ